MLNATDTKEIAFLNTIRDTIREAIAYDLSAIIALINPQLVDADHAAQRVHLLYEIKHWMRNSNGVVHGGIIATILDNAMEVLLRSYFLKSSATVNMQVNYLAPVFTNSALHIEASIIGTAAHNLINVSAFAWVDNAETPVASASALFKSFGDS